MSVQTVAAPSGDSSLSTQPSNSIHHDHNETRTPHSQEQSATTIHAINTSNQNNSQDLIPVHNTASLKGSDHDIPDLTPGTAEVLARVHSKLPESDMSRESSAPMSMSPSVSPPQTATGASSNTMANPFDRPRFDRTALTNAFAHALSSKSRTATPLRNQSPQKSAIPPASNPPRRSSPSKDSVEVAPIPSKRLKLTRPARPVGEGDDDMNRDQQISDGNGGVDTGDQAPTPNGVNGNVTQTPVKVSGKGLGRGRPGIKRGPRKPKVINDGADQPTQPQPVSTPQSESSTPVQTSGKGLGRGRPGIKRGPRKSTLLKQQLQQQLKRKREDSEDEPPEPEKVSESDESASEHELYTPQATQTKSGRQINRPSAFVLPKSPASSNKKVRIEEAGTSATPVRKPKQYRKGEEQKAKCENCDRRRDDRTNPIVFCDGCNLVWHQKCHKPRIPDSVILDKDAKWFCNTCNDPNTKLTGSIRIRANRRTKNFVPVAQGPDATSNTSGPTTASASASISAPASGPASAPSSAGPTSAGVVTASDAIPAPATAPAPPLTDRTAYCSHPEWSMNKRKDYFGRMSSEHLVELLLHATRVNPMLSLYRIDLPSPPKVTTATASETGSNQNLPPKPIPAPAVTPSSLPPTQPTISRSTPPLSTATSIPQRVSPPRSNSRIFTTLPGSPDVLGEDEEEDADELRALYPNPGDGVRLPPESEDMAMLLEGPESRTFSHRIWSREGAMAA